MPLALLLWACGGPAPHVQRTLPRVACTVDTTVCSGHSGRCSSHGGWKTEREEGAGVPIGPVGHRAQLPRLRPLPTVPPLATRPSDVPHPPVQPSPSWGRACSPAPTTACTSEGSTMPGWPLPSATPRTLQEPTVLRPRRQRAPRTEKVPDTKRFPRGSRWETMSSQHRDSWLPRASGRAQQGAAGGRPRTQGFGGVADSCP